MGLTLIEAATGCVEPAETRLEHLAAGRNPHRSCNRRDHAGRQGPTGSSRWGDWRGEMGRGEMDGCVVIAFKSVLLLLVNPVQNFFACLINHRSVILSWIPGHFD